MTGQATTPTPADQPVSQTYSAQPWWMPDLVGSFIGFIFAVLSVTPSLLPRPATLQAILAALAFAVGYLIGVAAWAAVRRLLWKDGAVPPFRRMWWYVYGIAWIAAIAVLSTLTVTWQNDVRALVSMPPLDGVDIIGFLTVFVPFALILILIGKGVRAMYGRFRRNRTSLVAGAISAGIVIGVTVALVAVAMVGIDRFFYGRNQTYDEAVTQPGSEHRSAGPDSVIDWEDLGRHGAAFIGGGPTADEIADVTGREAMTPVRVYAGLDSAETLEARFVISAVGSLNLPMLPDIPGTNDFTGPMFHSARWPEDLDLGGLRFGLVGAGASGFQIGPAVAGEAEQLTVFQRTAQWIIPNPIYRQPVPPGDRWAVRHLPFYGRWLRFIESFSGIASGVDPYRVDPAHDDPTARSVNATNSERAEALVGWMTSVLDGRPDLVEQAIPDYPALGKRILQDDGTWLRTLMRPDVELVRSGIDRIVADGIVTSDGVHRPLDAICFATGFRHNDFLASMEVRGRDGVLLADKWGDEPTAYLGISIPSFPNLFCTYGPGTNLAAGASLFFHAEYQMHHALELIRSTLASGARTCEVTDAAHDDYVERSQAELDTLVWTHPSIRHSHFKNTDGRVFTLSPWPIDLYREWTRRIDRDAYRFH